MRLAIAVKYENGARDDRCRSNRIVLLDDGVHVVTCQDLERGTLRRTGQRMGVLAHVKRAVSSLAAAVVTDRLRDCQDVGFGERAAQRRTPGGRWCRT